MKKEDIPVLNQLVKSLEESLPRLEEAYSKGDSEKFNASKKFILKIQKQIEETIK